MGEMNMLQATTAALGGALPDATAIGRAIRARREELGLTQAKLAKLIGLPAPQSLSDIENGKREVKAHELVRIAQALHTDMDVLLGLRGAPAEPRVLWRRGTKAEDRTREAQLLDRVRRYAQLEEWCGEEPAQPLPSYDFDPRTATNAQVARLAEQTRRALELGAIPAAALQRTLEESYGVKIFVECLEGDQAGACVRSEIGSAILLNGANVPWRRNFSLAHEVFHLVTWAAVEAAWDRGPHNEEGEPAWYQHLERLANHFAANLLLPAETVKARIDAFIAHGQITYEQIAALACSFEVSVDAFLYRLTDFGLITREAVKATLQEPEMDRVKAEVMRPLLQAQSKDAPWYPERYVMLAVRAYQRGIIGKSIVAKYLEVPYGEVEAMDLGEPHGSEAALSLA